MSSLNFGRDTSADKHEEFLEHYYQFINDDLSILKAKPLIASAWHLVDWTYAEYNSLYNFPDSGAYRESLYSSCESLKIMHDLANASKHKFLTRPKADLKNTGEHQGDFCEKDFNTVDFDVSYLEIEKNDGTKLSFRDEIEKVKEFWFEYFKDK